MQKKVNYIVGLLTSVILFTLVSALPLLAETNNPSIKVSEYEKVSSDTEFSVKVELDDNTSGLLSTKLMLTYDQTAIELIGFLRGDALAGLNLTTSNIETDKGYSVQPFVFLFDGQNPDFSNGTVLILNFRTKPNIADGLYDIKFEYDPSNTTSDYKTPVKLIIQNGHVNVDNTFTENTTLITTSTTTSYSASITTKDVSDSENYVQLPDVILGTIIVLCVIILILIIIVRLRRF